MDIIMDIIMDTMMDSNGDEWILLVKNPKTSDREQHSFGGRSSSDDQSLG